MRRSCSDSLLTAESSDGVFGSDTAPQKDPELPDVPSALDFVKNDADRKVMELYLTEKTVARPVIAPPGIRTSV